MIERISRNPWLLGGAFLVSALLGAALFALIQMLVSAMGSDRARTEAIVRSYLLAHGEIIPEAMDKLQERQAAERGRQADAALVQHQAVIAKPYAGAWQGNPNGDVTVTAFMDYNCGYCRANLPALAQLVAKDPGVRVVYREYPVLSDESVVAARWALAAAEQGKFMPFHDALYAGGPLSAATIGAAAAKAGLDRDAASKAIGTERVSAEIQNNYRFGQDLHIAGTPGWVIGKRVYFAAMSLDELTKAVAEARAGK